MSIDTPLAGVNSRSFRLVWAGQTFSQIGRALGGVAMPVLAVQLLGATPEQVGYLGAAGFAAFLVVGLPAGAWVDRWHKRSTMIVADVVRFFALAAIPALWMADALAMWHLYAVALVVGCATVFFDVAYQSILPFLVPHDELGTANGRFEATAQISNTAGPALGGLLLKVVSAPFVIVWDAIGYLASGVFLFCARDNEHLLRNERGAKPHGSLYRDIAEGVTFVLGERSIWLLAVSTMLANIWMTLLFTMLPLLALRVLGVGTMTFGLITTMGGLGGLAGALLVGRLRARFSASWCVLSGMAASIIGLLCLAFPTVAGSTSVAVAVMFVGMVISGVGMVVYNVTQVTVRQSLCPPDLLGRMNASIRFANWGVMPLSALAAGWLAGAFGVEATMWIGGLGSITAILPLLFLPAEQKERP